MPTVLYLAHGFPPASGSGAVRSLGFARYLPMYGWRPIVLTPGVGSAVHPDGRLLAQVPAWLEVVRTRSLEPGGPPAPAATQTLQGRASRGASPERHAQRHTVEKRSHTAPGAGRGRHRRGLRGLAGSIKGHLGHARRFPDAHVGWVPFAVWAGLRLAPRVDVLYSSSGPFSSHLVGLVLHLLTGRPWVAELRDGWYLWNRAIFPDYPVWRGVLEGWLEGQVLRRATRVVCVTDRMASAFQRQYADLAAGHFSVVPNGFLPEMQVASPAEGHRAGGFTVVHAGALYYGRSIRPFLDAAGRLIVEDAEFARDFRLDLIGTLDATAAAEVAGSAVADRVRRWGQLDHAATLARERAADLLLLVANTTPGAEATVPAKLFEYLASRRPVLAIAPRASSTADVLASTGGGWLADANDPEAIDRQLRAAFSSQACQVDQVALARFDRRRLAGDLARVLEAALLA